MPLLRGLKMRLQDRWNVQPADDPSTGSTLVGSVLYDRIALNGELTPEYELEANHAENSAYYPSTPVIYALQADDAIDQVDGRLLQMGSGAPKAWLFDETLSEGTLLVDDLNYDSMLMPNSEDGSFTVSCWLYPDRTTGARLCILEKQVTGTSYHRFQLDYDDSTGFHKIVFTAANRSGSGASSVSATIVPEQWSLIVARCDGNGKQLTLDVLGSDGFLSTETELANSLLGCSLPGDQLVVACRGDLSSGKLASGSFGLQQVCFWDKKLTSSEVTELVSDGRGTSHWHDQALPATYSLAAYTDYTVDPPKGRYGIVPGALSRACDADHSCWQKGSIDKSPDTIVVSLRNLVAAPGGSAPTGDIVMYRNESQIIQGWRFGRTFESEWIDLACGASIRFFLESTPSHMSGARYRQYLGVESSWGSKYQIAKFRITLGISLIKTNDGVDFHSPSPSDDDYIFDNADSYTSYCSDLVSSGWTDFAEPVFEEDFTVGGTTYVRAACIVAHRYQFTYGVDQFYWRGGDYGWQMGVSCLGDTCMDSRYNYKSTVSPPGTIASGSIANGTKVVPTEASMNRPFTAVARGLIGRHGDGGGIEFVESLPFLASSFTAVIYPGEFVRPEPFSTRLVGGCIDCDVVAKYDQSLHDASSVSVGQVLSKEITIHKDTHRTQKALSGSVSPRLAGATLGGTDGGALLRVLSKSTLNNEVSYRPEYIGDSWSDPEIDAARNQTTPHHWGGALLADGSAQFTGVVDEYLANDSANNDGSSLLVDVRPDEKINPNEAGSYTAKLAITRFKPLPLSDDEDVLHSMQIDSGTIDPQGVGIYPTSSTAEVSVENCDSCPGASGDCGDVPVLSTLSGINWLLPPVTRTSVEWGPDIYTYDDRLFCSLHSPSEHETEVAAEDTLGGCPLPLSIRHSVTSLISETPELAGQITWKSPKYFWDHEMNGEFGFLCGTEPEISRTICSGRLESEYASFVIADISLACESGLPAIHVTYQVDYYKTRSVQTHSEYYYSWTDNAGDGTIKYLDMNFGIPVTLQETQIRRATFISSSHSDFCLRHLSNDSVVFDFERDVVVSESRCSADPGEDDFVARLVSDFRLSTKTPTSPVSTAIPDLSLPAGGPWHVTRSPGSLHTFEGHNGAVTSRPANKLHRVTAARPFTRLCVPDHSGHDYLDLFPDANILDCYQIEDIEARLDCFASYHAYIGRDWVFTYPPDPLAGMCPISFVPVVDFSSATITVAKSVIDNFWNAAVSFPSSYTIENSELAHVVLDQTTTNGCWQMLNDDGLLIATLNGSTWDLTFYSQENDRCVSVIARYRLAGFPFSRWSRYGKNQMQLVSADWTVQDWPKFITVEPV